MASVNYKIAFVHLTFKIKQTMIAMLGVVFGISMYVFMNSFMSGINDLQVTLAFSTMAHIRIYNDIPPDHTNLIQKVVKGSPVIRVHNGRVIKYTEGIKSPAPIIKWLTGQDETTGIEPQVNSNVFFRNGGNKVNGKLSGIDVEYENKLFNIASFMVSGRWSDLQYQPEGIIMGSVLAKSLSINMGNNVNLLTNDGVSKNYKLVGTFQTGETAIDNSKAYVNINSARQLLGKNQDYVTDIQVNIKNYRQTAPLIGRMVPVIPYKVESWEIANAGMLSASKLRDIIAIAVSLTILMVAGFGIFNIMNMTINEKIREIAILKAIGFSGRDVTVIFLSQALVIGLIGGILGLLFGYVVCLLIGLIPFKLEAQNHLPFAYHFSAFCLAFCFGLIITLFAGYLPARKAAGIDPVTIIRG
jgi:lipoprotein-releasing system permease protein